MIINQVGTGGTSRGKFTRRDQCGYAEFDAETATYEIRLNDRELIGEIRRGDGYRVTEIDDTRGTRAGLGRYDTLTQALRALFGKPGYGYSWYEMV